jgi:hypothetical protein
VGGEQQDQQHEQAPAKTWQIVMKLDAVVHGWAIPRLDRSAPYFTLESCTPDVHNTIFPPHLDTELVAHVIDVKRDVERRWPVCAELRAPVLPGQQQPPIHQHLPLMQRTNLCQWK